MGELCNVPHNLHPDKYHCTREKNHPGEHCQHGDYQADGVVHNVWWPTQEIDKILNKQEHYPEEWTDVNNIRRLTCVCGNDLPCPEESK